MSKTYELETILKGWSRTKVKNKVVVFTYGGDMRWDDIHMESFDMESEALDYITETLGDSPDERDFSMFDLRDGVSTPKKREFKNKDNVIVIGGKYAGKRAVYRGSYFDGEKVSVGNSMVRIMDEDADETYMAEVKTTEIDLDE